MRAPGLTRPEPEVQRPAQSWPAALYTAVRSPGPGERLTRWLLLAAFVPAGIGAVLIVALHLEPGYGGVNPITGMLSDYALEPLGWMFNLALILIGAGSLALWLALARYRILTGPVAALAMGAWCIGLIGIAVFAKDPAHGRYTAVGGVHLYVTAISCGAMPVLCAFIGWRHRRHADWRRPALGVFWLAMANIPCVLPFLIAFALNRITGTEDYSGPATGLIERGMGVLDLIALVVLGCWAARAARNRAAEVAQPAG